MKISQLKVSVYLGKDKYLKKDKPVYILEFDDPEFLELTKDEQYKSLVLAMGKLTIEIGKALKILPKKKS